MSSVDSPSAEENKQQEATNWEAEVLRRIAPRLAELKRRTVQEEHALGWEAAGVRRLAEFAGEER